MDRPNPEPEAGADLVARCHADKAVIRQLEGLCRTSEWPVIQEEQLTNLNEPLAEQLPKPRTT